MDDLTFQIETEGPCPYLPYIVSFITSSPVPRWQVERFGAEWTEPEYCVSNFTYRLAEWNTGSNMTFALDPNYNGPHKALLEEIIVKFIGAQRPGTLPYENGEIDAYRLDPIDYERVRQDERLAREIHRMPEFTTWYLFFQTRQPPFDDARVRQAIARAIDRSVLSGAVLNDLAIPAYSMLPPGFPGYSADQFKASQTYDPDEARRLMAEAGYPEGRGFPKTELWLRVADTGINRIAGEAVQAMLKETLGIELEIRYQQRNVFNENLFQWQIPMGMLVFVYDYPDPSNMLGLLWRSQPRGYARHDWLHAEFDDLLDRANTHMDPAVRYDLYARARAHPGGGGGCRLSLPSGDHGVEKTLSPGRQAGPGWPRGADHIDSDRELHGNVHRPPLNHREMHGHARRVSCRRGFESAIRHLDQPISSWTRPTYCISPTIDSPRFS